MSVKKIIHVDMDCFYAAVEIRDNPSLVNKPVAVGGRAERRGVIATCNYTAREYGIHSAMPSAQAKQLCPELVILPPNLKKYRDVSRQIHAVFSKYTEIIEPLSLDEAYLDVSDATAMHGSATLIAKAIKDEISRTINITASAGVAPCKFIAKVASDWEKPDGLTVITPEQVDDFVFQLPVKKIHGVGKVTNKKLANLGIRTCGDLQNYTQEKLIALFGRFGRRLYEYARGIDKRSVSARSDRKSISVESTLDEDALTVQDGLNHLPNLISQLSKRMARYDELPAIEKLFVKLKFNDFTLTTIETGDSRLNVEQLQHLLTEAWQRNDRPVRLIGIGVRLRQNNMSTFEQIEIPFH